MFRNVIPRRRKRLITAMVLLLVACGVFSASVLAFPLITDLHIAHSESDPYISPITGQPTDPLPAYKGPLPFDVYDAESMQDVFIGMTEDELAAAMGEPLARSDEMDEINENDEENDEIDENNEMDEDDESEIHEIRELDRVTFTYAFGEVELINTGEPDEPLYAVRRIVINTPEIAGPRGLRVGSGSREIERLFPSAIERGYEANVILYRANDGRNPARVLPPCGVHELSDLREGYLFLYPLEPYPSVYSMDEIELDYPYFEHVRFYAEIENGCIKSMVVEIVVVE